MPPEHRIMKQKEAMKLEDDLYAIRVENLTNDVTYVNITLSS